MCATNSSTQILVFSKQPNCSILILYFPDVEFFLLLPIYEAVNVTGEFLRNFRQFSLTLLHALTLLAMFILHLVLAHFANENKKITRQPLYALRVFEGF